MIDKTYVIANWKMNLNVHESSLYLHKLDEAVKAHRTVETILAPSTLALQAMSCQLNHRKFKLCAQNCYWRDSGAYTGEISASQLRGVTQYVLIGHSERRNVFGETQKETGKKVQAVIRNNMRPVLCVGETALEKSQGETGEAIHDQLTAGLAGLTNEDMKEVIIAYEPVWAISNGNNFGSHTTPKPHDLYEVQSLIRRQLGYLFGDDVKNKTPVLYGGSVDENNVGAFLSVPGVNGVLVGGASLHLQKFTKIVEVAYAKRNVKR